MSYFIVKRYEEDKKQQLNFRSLHEQEKTRGQKNQSPSKPIDILPIKASIGPVWGVTITPRATSHTLRDVMNEELNKISASKPLSRVPEISTFVGTSTSPKGWNKINTPTSITSPLMPLSQILEIEKNSKEQYKKIVNRNMDSIVLEEKAIENLRKLYNADDNRDMKITIELIYDSDLSLSNYTPIWRK